MNISLPGEILFHLFGIPITNTILTGWIVAVLVLLFGFVMRHNLKKVPGRLQSILELAYGYFHENALKIIGREDVVRAVYPLVMTVFLYVLFSNWFGLLPGVGEIGFKESVGLVPILRSPTSDLNTTIALAVLVVVYIQYLGMRFSGTRHYLGKFFNFSSPLGFFVGLIELISEFSRIISFSFRLFGNVFGGEVLLTVVFYLIYTMVPFIGFVPVFFMAIELFISFVQAFIFAFLIIVFTSLAVSSHGDSGVESKVPETVAETEIDIEKHHLISISK